MGVFDRQVATAQRLIAKNGASVIWRKTLIPADDNPANPTAGTSQDFPVKIVFLTNEQVNLFTTLTMMKGSDVPTGKLYGLMGAVTFDPAIVDLIVGTPYGDLRMQDKNGINRLAPNGQTILYTLRFSE